MANDKSDKEKKEPSQLSDMIRKIVTAGSPADISKELIGTVLNQALKTRDDISSLVTNEMIALVRKIDFPKEISKFAETHKFKVSAEIEIIKRDTEPTKGEK